MLTDAQVERYARQVLLPEVGGRGQARLLAARVAVAGAGAAATAAALLSRAGVGALDLIGWSAPLPEPAPDCRLVRRETLVDLPDILVDLTDDAAVARRMPAGLPVVVGHRRGAHAVLALLVGRPCLACLPVGTLAVEAEEPASALAEPAALALGALAASEALRALLAPPASGRLHVLSLDDGVFRTSPLAAGPGCTRCGGTA
jgi:hypothetical protein